LPQQEIVKNTSQKEAKATANAKTSSARGLLLVVAVIILNIIKISKNRKIGEVKN